MVDVNKNHDLVLGFKATETAEELSNIGAIQVTTGILGDLVIPCGPLVPHGVINYKRYLVRARMTPGVPNSRIGEELALRCKKMREIEVPNLVIEPQGLGIPIQYGSIECYMEFNSKDEALELGSSIKVDGYPVQLRHKGLY